MNTSVVVQKAKTPNKNIVSKKILFLSLNAPGIQGFIKGPKTCGDNVCELTDDETSLQKELFDAIVFDIICYRSDHSARQIIPNKRKYDQRYIMYTAESSQMDTIPPLINEVYLSRYFSIKNPSCFLIFSHFIPIYAF